MAKSALGHQFTKVKINQAVDPARFAKPAAKAGL